MISQRAVLRVAGQLVVAQPDLRYLTPVEVGESWEFVAAVVRSGAATIGHDVEIFPPKYGGESVIWKLAGPLVRDSEKEKTK